MRTLMNALSRRWGFSPLGWLRNTWRMQAWARALGPAASPPAADASRICVVITPWLDTSVPWYTLAIGLLLSHRGNRVTFVLDGSPFGNKPARHRFVMACLRFVLNRLPQACTLVELPVPHGAAAVDTATQAAIDRLARLNAVWALRGEMVDAGRADYTRLCAAQMAAADQPIAQLLQSQAMDLLFVPGGVYGMSGLWVRHARLAGVRLASFDAGGFQTMMLACNGIACQLHDIPAAFSQLKDSCAKDADEQRFAMDSALAEMARRRAGLDKFSSQIQGGHGGDARYDGAVLLALNSSWDAAALGLHLVYRDNSEWIVETVRYLLEHTDAPVIVRQHPAERLPIASTTDDYRALLQQHFGTPARLHFIAAEETVNSYELLERVAAVVVYTSTIGTEAAALGKVVITPSSSYYAGLGFVWQCSDVASYQAQLAAAAAGRLQVSDAMRAEAHLCYYLTQCCNWVFSRFNPSDFQDWVGVPARQLLAEPAVDKVLTSLQHNIPMAVLNHRAALAQHRAASDTAAASPSPATPAAANALA